MGATNASPISRSNGDASGSHRVFDTLSHRSLTWIADPGIGYLQIESPSPYDGAYFAKYQGYARTPMGGALNEARLAFVERHHRGPLCDVGIGCGQFVASRPLTVGHDVNPVAVDWLTQRELYVDPRAAPVDAATFWDSLEHIADPAEILAHVRSCVFVSLPIFRDLAHVLASRHYRPDEHCWYFTGVGFVAFMAAHGWRLLEIDDFETALGREDIWSFAFTR